MPDSNGAFKGISVGRLYPGHRDYQPGSEPIREGDHVRITTGIYKGERGRVHDIKMQLAPFIYSVAFPWDDGLFGFQKHELERA